MAYDLAKVTANGNNLIAQILANKSSLSIDKIEISDTQLPSTTDISTMTSVPKVVQTVSANGFSKNSNTLIISTVVDNSSIRTDYKAWVFGIWGSDSQNGQSQLIAVITSTNSPDTIPAFSGRTPVSYTYKFNIGFSNASQIQFNMIDDSFATNDTVVHTTGDETINGQKKFKTDPTDSAGNAYAKTVDVNQQLDKKVNVADMRKPASDVAGIEEVNAKQDKIGYTPADDSKVVHNSSTTNWQKVKVTDDNGNIYSQLLKDSSSSWESSNGGWATPEKTISLTAGVEYFISAEFKCSGVDTSGIELQLSGAAGTNTATFSTLYGSSTIGSISKGFIASGTQGFLYIGPFTPTITGNYHIVGGMENSSNTGYWRKTTVTASNTYVPWETAMANSISPIDNQDDTISINGKSYVPADDSKVVHNSGTEEIAGQKTFDIAPIDKTTGNPYITKDGVPNLPPDLARTGKANTFTAAQTFSIAPTITDASKDKGDNQAATMADLKSVEKAAWHPVSVSMANFTIENAFYKKDNTKMTYELFIIAKDDTYYANQKDVLFQDPNIHSFGDLNPDTVYGEFGLTYSSFSDTGKVITKCSTSGNKIYYENSYSGTGNIAEEAINICGYIHITGTFK